MQLKSRTRIPSPPGAEGVLAFPGGRHKWWSSTPVESRANRGSGAKDFSDTKEVIRDTRAWPGGVGSTAGRESPDGLRDMRCAVQTLGEGLVGAHDPDLRPALA